MLTEVRYRQPVLPVYTVTSYVDGVSDYDIKSTIEGNYRPFAAIRPGWLIALNKTVFSVKTIELRDSPYGEDGKRTNLDIQCKIECVRLGYFGETEFYESQKKNIKVDIDCDMVFQEVRGGVMAKVSEPSRLKTTQEILNDKAKDELGYDPKQYGYRGKASPEFSLFIIDVGRIKIEAQSSVLGGIGRGDMFAVETLVFQCESKRTDRQALGFTSSAIEAVRIKPPEDIKFTDLPVLILPDKDKEAFLNHELMKAEKTIYFDTASNVGYPPAFAVDDEPKIKIVDKVTAPPSNPKPVPKIKPKPKSVDEVKKYDPTAPKRRPINLDEDDE